MWFSHTFFWFNRQRHHATSRVELFGTLALCCHHLHLHATEIQTTGKRHLTCTLDLSPPSYRFSGFKSKFITRFMYQDFQFIWNFFGYGTRIGKTMLKLICQNYTFNGVKIKVCIRPGHADKLVVRP